MTSPVVSNFETFLGSWSNRQETLQHQLLSSISPQNVENTQHHQDLISQVLSHYEHYYEEKTIAARDDVFVFLHPPWLSSFERTLTWLGEFKPSVIFRIITNSLTDLTPEQSERIQQLKIETRIQERALTEAMARIQESLAAPPILGLTRRSARLIDGEVSDMEVAVEALKAAMLTVLESADALRGSVVIGLVEILSPVQAVRFLAAALEFQIQMRAWGRRSDAQRFAASNGLL
ncbi:protein ZW2-like [Mercurialis annua]|uniref:protein ZW2-like n=1 Tax=Mercurialis annua TaxID=3986 RepID=UPI0021606F1F|nr:protein ZW2-like [Mercurialis annua]